ncbi:flavodoxin [Companilactobacillus hulinensis]|uniref:flavodoxin n=1 Tax=Companilactobacillus hulinensis TaxID=2486007 RepID=UPI000F7696F8|nr:flavodoxin [Companilactobacillus hulinensis]
MKSIVIYFSTSGNTKKAAESIAKKTGSDIEELKAVQEWPKVFDDLGALAQKQRDTNVHPEIASDLDLSKYDKIYLGYPTWYEQPPMIINSFFDKFKLDGKTVVPFSTSGSSTFEITAPYVKTMTKGTSIKLEKGFRANSEAEIVKGLE